MPCSGSCSRPRCHNWCWPLCNNAIETLARRLWLQKIGKDIILSLCSWLWFFVVVGNWTLKVVSSDFGWRPRYHNWHGQPCNNVIVKVKTNYLSQNGHNKQEGHGFSSCAHGGLSMLLVVTCCWWWCLLIQGGGHDVMIGADECIRCNWKK
jgi:hypothetical protein